MSVVLLIASHQMIFMGCGVGSYSSTLSISRSDSSLSESKYCSLSVSVREYEGRCHASLVHAWHLVQGRLLVDSPKK